MNCYWINQKCTKCSAGSFYDGVQCTTGQLVQKRCPGPYQFFNGRICVCIEGFFMTGNQCVTCPIARKWNGYYCEPTAFYSLNEAEEIPPSNTV